MDFRFDVCMYVGRHGGEDGYVKSFCNGKSGQRPMSVHVVFKWAANNGGNEM